MKYLDFLNAVIDGGIAAANRDYAADEAKRDGAVAGFEACRGLHPGDLATLLETARAATRETRDQLPHHPHDYWWRRCRELEIEWTCNVVAAAFMVVETRRLIERPPIFLEWRDPPVPITARGALCAANILGIRS